MLPEQRMHASDRRYGRKDARRGATELTPDIGSSGTASSFAASLLSPPAAGSKTHHRRHGYEVFPGVVLQLIAATMLEHDPEKCEAVFRKDHAQSKTKSAMAMQPHPIAL
jgi:hypothetical protein